MVAPNEDISSEQTPIADFYANVKQLIEKYIINEIENGTYRPGQIIDSDTENDWDGAICNFGGILLLGNTGRETQVRRVDEKQKVQSKRRTGLDSHSGDQAKVVPTESVQKAINVNDFSQPFTDQIFADNPKERKTIETRSTVSLHSLVGERVAINSDPKIHKTKGRARNELARKIFLSLACLQ